MRILFSINQILGISQEKKKAKMFKVEQSQDKYTNVILEQIWSKLNKFLGMGFLGSKIYRLSVLWKSNSFNSEDPEVFRHTLKNVKQDF